MIRIRSTIIKSLLSLLAALTLLLIIFISPTQQFSAAGTAEVSTYEEFIAAVYDTSVTTVAFTTSSIVISETVNITHDISFSGIPTTLTTEIGAQIKISPNVIVSFSNIRIESSDGYAVSNYGKLSLGENTVISGSGGILLNTGSEITSNGHSVSVAPSVVRALGVSAENGSVTVSNLTISQSIGTASLIYLHQSSGELLLSGNTLISSTEGNAIMCPNDVSVSPSVTITPGANIDIYAPNARNTGNPASGAAIDTFMGKFTVSENAVLRITGSRSAVIAGEIFIGNNSKTDISCISDTVDSYALSSSGKFNIESNAALNIGMTETANCGGIYSKDELRTGAGCQISIRCIGNAVSCTGSITLSDDTSLIIRDAKDGIVCSEGMISGNRCSIDISGVTGYGIRSTGRLIEEKLLFGEKNTISISAGYCAIYTREAVQIETGGRMQLTAGTEAPALWVDPEQGAIGYVTVIGSNVTVSSSANSTAAHNAGIYVVGAITVEHNSVFFAECSGDFAITSVNGDINVSSESSLYARGGCGLYLLNGDIRISYGGAIYAHGIIDSAVRIENGVINAGERSVIDMQGARFGAEVLGEGGLRISGAASYDIRSTTERAVYIENGSLSIENVERISVWNRAEDGNNTALWWSGSEVDTTAAAWELTAPDSALVQNYAQHTMLSPSGTQTFRSGEPVNTTSLGWGNTPWNIYDYSRIGMYKSRPFARSNTFNIPAGKSFSWWLYGESYDGEPAKYRLFNSIGDGKFELSENGKFTYTAPDYARGIQSFSFTVTNSENVTSEPAEIKINVTASKPPISYSSTFFTAANQPLLEQLKLQDFDGAISNTIVSKQPAYGTLTLSSDGKFLYTPNEGFVGIDDFEFYSVDDFDDNSNIAYVTVIVGATAGIYANNDTYATDNSTTVNARLVVSDISAKTAVTSASDVSSSDIPASDSENYTAPEGLRYYITEYPKYGTFSVSEDGLVSYTPFEDFAGSDVFKYYAEDVSGNKTNEAHVTIAIIPSQRPTSTEGYYACAKNYYCNGSLIADDVDGTIIGYEIDVYPESGTLTLDEQTGSFTYKPDNDYLGTVYFSFRSMDDDGLLSDETIVYIDVMSLVDALRATGRFIPAILAVVGIAASIVVIAVLLISAAIKRHKREQQEVEEYYREMNYFVPKK